MHLIKKYITPNRNDLIIPSGYRVK